MDIHGYIHRKCMDMDMDMDMIFDLQGKPENYTRKFVEFRHFLKFLNFPKLLPVVFG